MNLKDTIVDFFDCEISQIPIEDLTYYYLIDNGYATSREIDTVMQFADYNIDTLNKILKHKTGYNNLEELTMESDDLFYQEIIKKYYLKSKN